MRELIRVHYVYIVKCVDETLYIGYTIDLQRRIHEHNHSSKGAKYTRARRPVTLVYAKAFLEKRRAYQYEYQLKQATRKQKLAVISQFWMLG